MITIVFLIFFSCLLIWQFVGYPALMSIVAFLSKPRNKDYKYQPFVSIVVPAYNEAKTIEKRIDNLFSLDYPKNKYEIIVVESGSTDETYQLVKNLIENNKKTKVTLKLLKESERKGKASAINLAKQHGNGDIILVTDANSTFDKSVLKQMMPHFEDPKIGAVGGRYITSNPGNALTSSESFYWDLEYIMRKGESAIDSACTFHGEINAWRRDIINADTRMLSEDLEMAISIRRKGYKIVYEPSAKVYAPSATTVKDQIKQRKRTSIGTIQCMFKHLGYFLPPRDLYSLLIFPSHKALAMFSPFILLAIAILYVIAWDVNVIVIHLVSTILALAIIYALLAFFKSKLTKNETTQTSFSLASIPQIAYYVLLNEYLILLAWENIICKKYSVLWEKAETTR